MDEPVSVSTSAFLVMAGTYAASVTALFYLFQRHISGSPLLAYEPRHRVPWGPAFALVAILIPLTTVMAAILDPTPTTHRVSVADEAHEETPGSAEPVANDFVRDGLFTCSLMIVFVMVVAYVLHDFVGADANDFGLPKNAKQFAADVGLGAVACVASMLPIHMTMFVLTKLLLPETEHPLVTELQKSHTPTMMLVGVVMVVIAAPLFEEFSFRLLLQGWLEKWEDEQVSYSGTLRPAVQEPIVSGDEIDDREPEDSFVLPTPRRAHALPRRGVLSDLPHGWLPILTSATLFGLAHWGHGVSPVPLVMFGIVLGYLYQRTHRLVPSIAAHAVFNAYTMVALWLSF